MKTEPLLVKHFAGWLEPKDGIILASWSEVWQAAAAKAKLENKKLIVFAVPEPISADLIREIEAYLQGRCNQNNKS